MTRDQAIDQIVASPIHLGWIGTPPVTEAAKLTCCFEYWAFHHEWPTNAQLRDWLQARKPTHCFWDDELRRREHGAH